MENGNVGSKGTYISTVRTHRRWDGEPVCDAGNVPLPVRVAAAPAQGCYRRGLAQAAEGTSDVGDSRASANQNGPKSR